MSKRFPFKLYLMMNSLKKITCITVLKVDVKDPDLSNAYKCFSTKVIAIFMPCIFVAFVLINANLLNFDV